MFVFLLCFIFNFTLIKIGGIASSTSPPPDGYLFDYILNIYLLRKTTNQQNPKQKHTKRCRKSIAHFLPDDNNSWHICFQFLSLHFRPNREADEICLCSRLLFGFCVLPFCSAFLLSVASYFLPLAHLPTCSWERITVLFKNVCCVTSVSFLPKISAF